MADCQIFRDSVEASQNNIEVLLQQFDQEILLLEQRLSDLELCEEENQALAQPQGGVKPISNTRSSGTLDDIKGLAKTIRLQLKTLGQRIKALRIGH